MLQAGLTILVRRVTLGTLEVAPLVGQDKIHRRGFPQFVKVFRVGLEFFVGGKVLKSGLFLEIYNICQMVRIYLPTEVTLVGTVDNVGVPTHVADQENLLRKRFVALETIVNTICAQHHLLLALLASCVTLEAVFRSETL